MSNQRSRSVWSDIAGNVYLPTRLPPPARSVPAAVEVNVIPIQPRPTQSAPLPIVTGQTVRLYREFKFDILSRTENYGKVLKQHLKRLVAAHGNMLVHSYVHIDEKNPTVIDGSLRFRISVDADGEGRYGVMWVFPGAKEVSIKIEPMMMYLDVDSGSKIDDRMATDDEISSDSDLGVLVDNEFDPVVDELHNRQYWICHYDQKEHNEELWQRSVHQ